jgi:hypothetical protein
MAILDFTGLETLDNSEFNFWGPSISTGSAQSRSGRYSLKIDQSTTLANATAIWKDGLGDITALRAVAFSVRFAEVSAPAAESVHWLYDVLNSAGALVIRLEALHQTTGGQFKIRAIGPDGSTVLATSGLLEKNTWYVVRVETTQTSAAWYVDIDGTVLGSGTLSVGRAIDQISFYNFVSSADGDNDFFFDDIALAEARTDIPVDSKVIAMQGTTANETPTYTQWTLTGGPIESVWSYTASDNGGTHATSPGTGDPLAHTMYTQNVGVPVPGPIVFSHLNDFGATTFQGGTAGSGETSQALGQGFTPSTTITVDTVWIYTEWQGTPTDSVTVEIVSGSIDGTVIATGTTHANRVAYDTGGNNGVDDGLWILTAPVTLTGGVEYFLRASRTGARDTSNYFQWSRSSVSDITGSRYVRDNNVWSAVDAADLNFYLHSSGGTALSTATFGASKICMFALRSSGSARTHELRRRVDTTDTDTAFTLTTATAYYQTGPLSLSYTDLNALQIGGEKSGGAGGRSMEIRDMWVQVHYTPAAAGGQWYLPLLGVGQSG